MKVQQLKEYLLKNEISDDTEILVPSQDHSYRKGNISKTTAVFHLDNYICEDFGDEDLDGGIRKHVIVID